MAQYYGVIGATPEPSNVDSCIIAENADKFIGLYFYKIASCKGIFKDSDVTSGFVKVVDEQTPGH